MPPKSKKNTSSKAQQKQEQQQQEQQQFLVDDAQSQQQKTKKAWVDDDDQDDEHRLPVFAKAKNEDAAAAKPSWAQRRQREDDNKKSTKITSQHGLDDDDDEDSSSDQQDDDDEKDVDFFEDSKPFNAADSGKKDENIKNKKNQKQNKDESSSSTTINSKALLRAALASTAPVLTSLSSEQALLHPRPSSTIMLPQEKIKDIAWHPTSSSSLLCVTTTRQVHTYHVSGKFTEKMSTWKIPGKGLAQSAILQRGEKMMILAEDAYVPITLELATGNVESLNFLDFRNSTSAVFSVRGTATDGVPTVIATVPGDEENEIVAVPAGSRMSIASIRHGALIHSVTCPGIIADAIFVNDREVAVACPNSTVLFYDIRSNSGRCVKKLTDPSLLGITRLSCVGNELVVGSSNGIVSTYSLSGAGSIIDPTPVHSFTNLTASIDLLATGKTSRRSDSGAILFGSSLQESGFRLATVPNGKVVQRFPAASMNHHFLSCVAYSSGISDPTVSIGEYGRIVNYAC